MSLQHWHTLTLRLWSFIVKNHTETGGCREEDKTRQVVDIPCGMSDRLTEVNLQSLPWSNFRLTFLISLIELTEGVEITGLRFQTTSWLQRRLYCEMNGLRLKLLARGENSGFVKENNHDRFGENCRSHETSWKIDRYETIVTCCADNDRGSKL